MRDNIFQSGLPLMVAAVCFTALAYLARIRRETFLVYWTAAWALLVVRYAWNVLWGTLLPLQWMSIGGAMLRTGFALTLLGGALALRQRRAGWWWIVVGAIAVPLFTSYLASTFPGFQQMDTNLNVMAMLILVAAWHVARASQLPRQERLFVAAAIAIYGVLSAAMPRLGEDSPLLSPMLMIAWSAQLFVGIGMIAMYFRLSYEREVLRERQLGETLAEALRGYVSICMHCKAVRDEAERWQRLESFVAARSKTVFSHGLCDDCATTIYAAGDLGDPAAGVRHSA